MPLPPPAEREHLHNRDITLKGYVRADGLYDIEGTIVDTKTYSFQNEWRGEMTPGRPIHNMSIRLTLNDDFEVLAVAAVTDDSPFLVCPDIVPNFQELVGLKIGPGWNRRVKEKLGGIKGCTHLVELLGPVATVAFQTIRPYQRYLVKKQLEPDADDPTTRRPWQIDTCYGWAADHAVVQRYLPDHYTGPGAGTQSAPNPPRNGTGSGAAES